MGGSLKIAIFKRPESHRQARRQQRQAADRLRYLVEFILSAELRREYRRQAAALAKPAPYPPHRMEYHVPNQGCLFCRIELVEGLLMGDE
jgi:hypothetical protein